jgi:prepilin-type processing-associated H-X9-DG protein
LEILVVIAVIAALTSLLLPVLGRAREGARRTLCLSNLHQIGLATKQYLDDNNNRYPIQDLAPGQELTYALLLQPYIKNTDVFICPSDNGAVSTTVPTDDVDHEWQANGITGGYSMNNLVQNVSEIHVRQPSEMALFVDNRTFSDSGYLGQLQYCGRHSGGVNVCYADYRVKWISLTDAAGNLNFSP